MEILNILKEFTKDFFAISETIGPIDILINLLLAGLMSYLIYRVYIRLGFPRFSGHKKCLN